MGDTFPNHSSNSIVSIVIPTIDCTKPPASQCCASRIAEMDAGGNAAAAKATAQFASAALSTEDHRQHLRRLQVMLVICRYRHIVPAQGFAEPSIRWPETKGADATNTCAKQPAPELEKPPEGPDLP